VGDVPHLSSDLRALRVELEDLCLSYDSFVFASIGFSENTEVILVSVGTDNMKLAKAEVALLATKLWERVGDRAEIHLLKGRTRG